MEKYTTKLGDKICEHTATSSIGLRHICKQLNMPYSTVTSWIYDSRHELYQKYAHAKQMQLYHLEEEILEIADDSTNDYMTIVRNGKKVVVQNRESIARSRLRIQARISLITKLAPRTRRTQPIIPVHEEVDITVKNTPAPKSVKKATAPTTRAYATSPSPSLSRATVEGERVGERSHSSPKNTPKPAPVKLSENARLRAIYEEQLRSCVDNSNTSQNTVLHSPMRGYTERVKKNMQG